MSLPLLYNGPVQGGTVYTGPIQGVPTPGAATTIAQLQSTAARSIYEGGENAFYDGEPGGANIAEYTDFLGIAIGKKAKARKQQKFDIKMSNKASRGTARLLKGESRLALAQQGIATPTVGSAITSTLGTVANLAGSFMGGGGSSVTDTGTYTPSAVPTIGAVQNDTTLAASAGYYSPVATAAQYEPTKDPATLKKEKDQKTIYIVIGVVIAVIVIAFLLKKKK